MNPDERFVAFGHSAVSNALKTRFEHFSPDGDVLLKVLT